MNKHFNPAISEEKFAAWLDGMLSPIEMHDVSALVESDGDMQSLLSVANTLDDILIYNSGDYLQQDVFADSLSPTDFELPELNLPTIIPDTLSTQTNLAPDFLPDSGFDEQPVSETNDLDNPPITDMGQDMNDINV